MSDEVTAAVTAGALVTGALGGAAGNLLSDAAKRVAPKLWEGVGGAVTELLQRAMPAARAQFERNAGAFVDALAVEIAPAEAAGGAGAGIATRAVLVERATARAEAVVQQLADPDVAAAVADALRAAGRTSSGERHTALAKVVAARLAAATESTHAVAANLAIRAIESLGAVHLRTLGTLALVHYAARPNPARDPLPVHPPAPPNSNPDGSEFTDAQVEVLEAWRGDASRRESAFADRLVARLLEGARSLSVSEVLPESVGLHLEAAACVLRHDAGPDLPGVLSRVVEPADPIAPAASGSLKRLGGPFPRFGYRAHFADALRTHPPLRAVGSLWESSLRVLALTPAGLLVGLAVYDAVTGERTTDEWEWSGAAEHALRLAVYAPEPPFDAWARDRRFQEAVERAAGERLRDRNHAAGIVRAF